MLLVVKDVKEAHRLRKALQENGIRVWTHENPEACSAGLCVFPVEIHVEDEDFEKAKSVLKKLP